MRSEIKEALSNGPLALNSLPQYPVSHFVGYWGKLSKEKNDTASREALRVILQILNKYVMQWDVCSGWLGGKSQRTSTYKIMPTFPFETCGYASAIVFGDCEELIGQRNHASAISVKD